MKKQHKKVYSTHINENRRLTFSRLLKSFIYGAGSGNRTRTLSLEGSYDTISPYPLNEFW